MATLPGTLISKPLLKLFSVQYLLQQMRQKLHSNPEYPDSLLYTNHVPKDTFLLQCYFEKAQ
jgi:hypothetical protein